jgi:Immunity protein 35
MFDRESAEAKLKELINADYHVAGDEVSIVPERTIEKNYGWIFFCESKKYLETGEFSHRLAGNGPVVFEKESGLVHHLGSHTHPQELIREFEEKRAAQ